MHLFRLITGTPLAIAGLVLALAAVCLIANNSGQSSSIYVVWGLGLLMIFLGLKSAPGKKRRGRHKPQVSPHPKEGEIEKR
jgi:hypothetical protein